MDEILAVVCDTVKGVYGQSPSPEEVFTGRKMINIFRHVAAVRQFTHYVLHRMLSVSVSDIAKWSGMSRRNVFANVSKVEFLIKVDDKYSIINDRLKEIIK